MTEVFLYAVAKTSLILFGAPLAFLEPVRGWSLPARAAVAYGGGAAVLTNHKSLLAASLPSPGVRHDRRNALGMPNSLTGLNLAGS